MAMVYLLRNHKNLAHVIGVFSTPEKAATAAKAHIRRWTKERIKVDGHDGERFFEAGDEVLRAEEWEMDSAMVKGEWVTL